MMLYLVIQVYAHTFVHGEEDVEMFFKQLEKTTRAVIGDFNAKGGPDAYRHCVGTMSHLGLGRLMNRLERPAVGFVQTDRLAIASILYPHRSGS